MEKAREAARQIAHEIVWDGHRRSAEEEEQDSEVKMTLKGTYAVVQEAKAYLCECLQRVGVVHVPLLHLAHLEALERQLYGSLRRLGDKYPSLRVRLVHHCHPLQHSSAPEGGKAGSKEEPVGGEHAHQHTHVYPQAHKHVHMHVHTPHMEVTAEPAALKQAKSELYSICAKALPAGEFVAQRVDAACLRELFPTQAQLDECLRTLLAEHKEAEEASNGSSGAAADDKAKASLPSLIAHKRLAGVCDRDLGAVLVVGEAALVTAAQQHIERAAEQFRDSNASVLLDEALIPLFVGKAGAGIIALRKATGASIEVNRSMRRIDIQGSSREVTQAAVEAVEQKVHQLRSELWETKVPDECVPLLIGKAGANVKQLRADTGASIDIEASTGRVRVSG